MKFAHRLNVRALSAMVTGIMVASSMLASAAPVAAVAEVKNSISIVSGSGRGLQGTILKTDYGTFSTTPASYTYKWYRCADDKTGSTANTMPDAAPNASSCELTSTTKNTYTLASLDVLKPYVVAVVTMNGGDSHYSDAFVMKRKPALITTSPAADHYPEITSDDTTYAKGGASASTLTISEGDWVGEPYPDFTFNWLRCTSSAAAPTTTTSGCTAITASDGGVDSSTYDPTTKDVGYFIRVRITARNSFATVKTISPSWKGGSATVNDAANKVSGVPFTKGLISFAGRKANPGTWTALPTLDLTYGYTSAEAITDGHTGNGTPGFSYQWYACDDAVDLQSNTDAEWAINNSDAGADVLCFAIPGQTSRFLGTDYGDQFFVVKVTARNARGDGHVYSKSIYIKSTTN